MGVLQNFNGAVAARELQKQNRALPELLSALVAEQRRTNELLEALLERSQSRP